MAGYLSGIIRVGLMDCDSKARMVPVDFAVNSIIAATWKRSLNLNNDCTFYNCTDSPTNQIEWGGLNTHLHKIEKRFVPYEKLLYYPGVIYTKNPFVYTILFILVQFIPGVIFDIYLLLVGKKSL